MTSTTSTIAPPSVRYHHLDALRAVLMLAGIFVHAGTLGQSKLFDDIQYASGLVRMEGFFAVSGFLGAMLILKYGGSTAVRRRFRSLGVPLIAGLLILNPVTYYLVFEFHNSDASLSAMLAGDATSAAGPQVWHFHLWFLFVLLAYAALGGILVRLAQRVAPFLEPLAKQRRTVVILAAAIAVTAVSVGGRVAFGVVSGPIADGPYYYVLRSIVDYLGFYALGVLLFCSPALMRKFTGVNVPMLLLGALCVFGAARVAGDVGGRLGNALPIAAEEVFAVAFVAAALQIAAWLVPERRPAVSWLSDASYSVYLLHYLTIYVLATVLVKVFAVDTWFMLLIAALTFAVTFAIHQYVISRSTTLRFLLNGKPWRTKPASSGVAVPASCFRPSAIPGRGGVALSLSRARGAGPRPRLPPSTST